MRECNILSGTDEGPVLSSEVQRDRDEGQGRCHFRQGWSLVTWWLNRDLKSFLHTGVRGKFPKCKANQRSHSTSSPFITPCIMGPCQVLQPFSPSCLHSSHIGWAFSHMVASFLYTQLKLIWWHHSLLPQSFPGPQTSHYFNTRNNYWFLKAQGICLVHQCAYVYTHCLGECQAQLIGFVNDCMHAW